MKNETDLGRGAKLNNGEDVMWGEMKRKLKTWRNMTIYTL